MKKLFGLNCFVAFGLILELILAGQICADSNEYSVEIFGPSQIGNTEVLHSLAVDIQGRVYSVTPDEEKIFWFDGSDWHAHDFDGIPRLVVRDNNGEILLGSNRGVYRLRFDPTGQLQLESIEIDFGPQDDPSLLYANVSQDGVYLFNHMLRVKIDEPKPIVQRCVAGFTWAETNAHSSLLIPIEGPGLFQLVGEENLPVPGFEEFSLQGATYVDGSVFGWTTDGKLYRQTDDSVLPVAKVNERIVGGRILSLAQLENGNVGLTSTSGFFEIQVDGEIKNVIDRHDGLRNDFVYRFTEDSKTLWIGCGRNVAKVRPSNRAKIYRITDGSTRIHDFAANGQRLVFCTDYGAQGLSLESGLPQQDKIPELGASPIYSIHHDDEFGTVVASTRGLFSIEGDVIKPISQGRFYSLLVIRDGVILTSNQNGTVLLVDNRKSNAEVITGPSFPFEVRYLYRISDTEIMVSGWNGDWAAMTFNPETMELTPALTDSARMLKGPVSIDGSPAFLFDAGVFRPEIDEGKVSLVRHSIVPSLDVLTEGSDVLDLLKVGENSYIIASEKAIRLIRLYGNKIDVVNSWFLDGIGKPLPQYDADKNVVYCINNDKLMVLDLSDPTVLPGGIPVPVVASSFELGHEPIASNEPNEIVLPAKGGVRFSFSVPSCEFPSGEFEYQYRLGGLDDEWSNWSKQRRKEFTNLPGGDYVFQVRARVGPYLISRPQSVPMSVETPWYQTWLAYAVFLATGGLLALAVGSIRSRQLAKANTRMEELVKQRTRELEVQKERVRQKSEQLVTRTREDESERLESLSRMLGCIAHDFNNLLFVVSANCEMLEMSVEPSLKKSVDGIQAASAAAAGLCAQIQSFSGTMPSMQKQVSLSKEVLKVEDMLRPSVGKQVDLIFNLEPTEGCVFVDPTGLQQILLNLAVNAGEAGSDRIEIRTGESVLSQADLSRSRTIGREANPGVYQWFEVRDNGDGISDTDLNNIFDPFFSTKRLGRGLGLSIVIRIVTSNAGILFVESQQGDADSATRGTVFRVCLPRIESSEDQSAKSTFVAAHALDIFIVDDDASVVEALSGCLRGLGHKVHTADSGAKAERILLEGLSPDVLLIDVSMPDKNGDKVVAKLFRDGFEFPVFLMSGFNSDTLDDKLLADERVEFVRKPFLVQGLVERIYQKTMLLTETSRSNGAAGEVRKQYRPHSKMSRLENQST